MFEWKRRKQAPAAATLDVVAILAEADESREAGRASHAQALYQRALDAHPDNVYALYWLATGAQLAGDLARARALVDAGLALDPDQIGLRLLAASVTMQARDPMAALGHLERVRQLDADAPRLDLQLANQYTFLGRIDDAIAALDRALAREPEALFLQSYRLFNLNYSGSLGPEALFAEHRAWGESREREFASHRAPHPNTLDPERRLSIGFVSPDFREHAVAFFVEPMLRHHGTSLHITCFDVSPFREDASTERLRQHADDWVRVGAADDDALAAEVRKRGIDILVDCTGHMQYHRLLLFARKPAPVQATWLGYLNTTGLASVDYRITDAYLDPPGMTEQLHTEALMRLPNHACFAPPDSPAVTPSPAARNGFVTFGSINQWSKVVPPVREAWAQLLRTLPEARLVVIARGGANADFRGWIANEFVCRGANAAQIVVVPTGSLADFQRILADIDIALDPFPYGGGTTTLHALWMGVPSVTLAGRTPFARNSIGPLTEVGLADLVAATPQAYVETAVALARDRSRLAQLRATLRTQMSASPLVDGPRYASALEAAFRSMWRSYCAGALSRRTS